LSHETHSYRHPLPIDPILPEILKSIEGNTLTLLQAEPGAGKTTRVPAAALAAGLGPVFVLEPRRLAARMAARRVAAEMGQRLGERVGYRVRFEDVSGPNTQLLYLTEGVLTRRLLVDGELSEARLVVLDEFHERHLETDLALALLRDLQKRRKDLRLLIMSATLGENLAAALGNPPLIKAPGKLFPVSLRYTAHSAAPLEEQVAAAAAKAVAETKKHVLIFLPGAAEIRKSMAACEPIARQAGAILLPLHGDLTPEEQDQAVAPGSVRKIICSTNVAESSVTIEGVEAVIDSGTARVLTHSPWSGLSRLNVEKISQASAIQRAGRAGRTGAGLSIRLYPESDFVRRPQHLAPEILRADLSGTMLMLAAHGISWNRLDWLDQPSAEMLEHARQLLVKLAALDVRDKVTSIGRRMADLPLHPRLARFVLAGAEMGAKREACDLAARLSEGRLRSDQRSHGSDIEALLAGDLTYNSRRLRQQLLDQVRAAGTSKPDPHALEKALLVAFPDRVARKRGDRLLLAHGLAAQLDRGSFVHSEFIVAIEVDERDGQTPLVRFASAIEPDWLLDLFPNAIETREELAWNREGERVEQRNQLRYEQLAIDESNGPPTDPKAASEFLAAKAIEAGAERFADVEELARLMRRVNFAAEHLKQEIPEDAVAEALRELAKGCTSFAEMRNVGLLDLLQSILPMRPIDEIAPTHVQLPSGRRAKIEYHDGGPPSVASRLQDFFGMKQTPTVARGAVPLVVQLLAPNQRPVQVTTDLVSFWKNLYPQVRKELSRRYPRHSWPENPGGTR
jgi:ATP-dependent helicase HrpB